MHEMSLAESVLEIIENSAAQHGSAKVHAVWLEIGQLSCVETEAMRFCFDAVMRGSIAEQAKLEIIEVAGTGWCEQCASSMPMATLAEACPKCGNRALKIRAGDTMRVRELEVE